MTLYEELFFEITVRGKKADLKKFASFLKSGELDEFFEISSEYIIYDDNYADVDDEGDSEIIFTTDDYGIEIDEFEVDEFLELLCKAGKNLDLYGCIYDIDEEEYNFSSEKGDSYYINTRKAMKYNDELDEIAVGEESEED